MSSNKSDANPASEPEFVDAAVAAAAAAAAAVVKAEEEAAAEAAAATEAYLNEPITRVLKAVNPHLPDNVVRYCYKDGAYKSTGPQDHMIAIWEQPSTLIHKKSDEAARQRERDIQGRKLNRSSSTTTFTSRVSRSTQAKLDDVTEEDDDDDNPDTQRSGGSNGDGGDDGDDSGDPAGGGDGGDSGTTKILIQFSFVDRQTQTIPTHFMTRETQTVAPKRSNYKDTVTQWLIYDSCTEELARLEVEKKKKTAAGGGREREIAEAAVEDDSDDEIAVLTQEGDAAEAVVAGEDCSPVAKSAKILERMINMNTHYSMAQDMCFYEDPLDALSRQKTGMLMPLWDFGSGHTYRMAVTCITLCARYNDLFIAGYGSVSLDEPAQCGHVCLHSFKNPSHPDYVFTLPSGVLCVAAHPTLCHLLAVGQHDGRVAVLDVRRPDGDQPAFACDVLDRHTDQVRDVRWQRDDSAMRHNFLSISCDGYVVRWTVHLNKLQRTTITPIIALTERIPMPVIPEPWKEPEHQLDLARGCCFDFLPTQDHIYLMGTEEGIIHKCSNLYQENYLRSFKAHQFTVYAVKWNTFQPRVFASCGVDCTVKLWDDQKPEKPLFHYELDNVVTTFCWSPFSSTVFAVGTLEGMVHLYDLYVDKYNPLCKQLITKKSDTRLTQVAFTSQNLLLVGDDSGNVTSLKLSPNLRKALRNPNYSHENEITKMNSLIRWVWEPPSSSHALQGRRR